jgi:hypothetical protein
MNTLIRNSIGELTILATVAALALSLPFPAQAGPYTSKTQGAAAASAETGIVDSQCPVAKKHAGHWKKGKHHRLAMMKNLSPEEREKLKAIHAKLKASPEFQKAKQAVRDAETREARGDALRQLENVRKSQLSAEEQAFLDQLKAKRKGGKHCPANRARKQA